MTASSYIQNADILKVDKYNDLSMIGKIYERYEQRCRQSNAMDFDDLLLNTFFLFRDHPDVLEKYGTTFKHILVDEYQDTNYAQHCIVWQLTRHGAKVCVVGDDAQSIYSFRGANLDNMLKFSKLYPNSKLFKLEQNYRSTQTIVEAAGSLICKNHAQIPKNVFSENELGEKIKVSEEIDFFKLGKFTKRILYEIWKKLERIPLPVWLHNWVHKQTKRLTYKSN